MFFGIQRNPICGASLRNGVSMGGKIPVQFEACANFIRARAERVGGDADAVIADVQWAWKTIVPLNFKLSSEIISRTGVMALQREFAQALILGLNIDAQRPIDPEATNRYKAIISWIGAFSEISLAVPPNTLWQTTRRSLTARGFTEWEVAALERELAAPATTVVGSRAQQVAETQAALSEQIDRPLDAKETELHGLLERYRAAWDALKKAMLAQGGINNPAAELFKIFSDVPLWRSEANNFKIFMAEAKTKAVAIKILAPANAKPTAQQAQNVGYFKQMEDAHAERCALLERVSRSSYQRDDSSPLR
jgi:hypothetical protein